MHDYGLSLHEAVWRFPLSAAGALMPALLTRLGHRVPDARDRAMMRAHRAEGERLRREFRIID